MPSGIPLKPMSDTTDSAASPLPERPDTNKLEGLLDELEEASSDRGHKISDGIEARLRVARSAITEAFREVEAERDSAIEHYVTTRSAELAAACEATANRIHDEDRQEIFRHVEARTKALDELSHLRESLRELEAERLTEQELDDLDSALTDSETLVESESRMKPQSNDPTYLIRVTRLREKINGMMDVLNDQAARRLSAPSPPSP